MVLSQNCLATQQPPPSSPSQGLLPTFWLLRGGLVPLGSRPQGKENKESKLKRARRRVDLFAFPLMPPRHGAVGTEIIVTDIS